MVQPAETLQDNRAASSADGRGQAAAGSPVVSIAEEAEGLAEQTALADIEVVPPPAPAKTPQEIAAELFGVDDLADED